MEDEAGEEVEGEDSVNEDAENDYKDSNDVNDEKSGTTIVPLDKVASGEEDESQILQLRVKLYKLVNNSWAEAGSGPLRVNIHVSESESSDVGITRARLVMRQEKVLKLLLNCAITENMLIETVGNKMIRFSCEILSEKDSKPTFSYHLVKCAREDDRDTLFKTILRVKPNKSSDSSSLPASKTSEVLENEKSLAANE